MPRDREHRPDRLHHAPGRERGERLLHRIDQPIDVEQSPHVGVVEEEKAQERSAAGASRAARAERSIEGVSGRDELNRRSIVTRRARHGQADLANPHASADT
jgi:hypothetical protein